MIDQNLPMDFSEFGAEIPPVPREYQDLITEWGGNTGGKPNCRIVRGTDPELVDWGVKGWIPRYTLPEISEVEYFVWHKPDGKKSVLSPKEAQVINKKAKGIILPVRQVTVKDNLIPRYFVEIYKPPYFFGTPQTWESMRYDTDPATGEILDILGEFPSEGSYETWFCIEEVETNYRGEPLKSKFRALDETVLEFIREQIEVSKIKTTAQQHLENYLSHESEREKRKHEFKEDLKYKLRERIDRVVGTPTTLRRK